MRGIAATNHSLRRREVSTPMARYMFMSRGESHKAQWLDANPDKGPWVLYRLGDFEDLSRGPQVPSTSVLKAFNLTHLSGTSVQRVYGTCWSSQQELEDWHALQQVMVLSIDEQNADYVQHVTDALRRAGIKANSDLRNEKIGAKIRQYTEQQVPYLVIIGEKEKDGGYVSVRRGDGQDLGRMNLEGLCETVRLTPVSGAVRQPDR